MPTFTREEIVHLGDLARIALTDEEITRMQSELNVIADAIDSVQEVATADVEPTANPVPLEAYLRPDVPATPLTQAEALSGAPVAEDGMFVAPRILGEEGYDEYRHNRTGEALGRSDGRTVAFQGGVEP